MSKSYTYSVVVHTPLADAYLGNFEILFALLEAPYLAVVIKLLLSQSSVRSLIV